MARALITDPIADLDARWRARRDQYWMRRLGGPGLETDPIEIKLARRRKGNWSLLVIWAVGALLSISYFWLAHLPDFAQSFFVIFTPPIFFIWFYAIRFERRVKKFFRERDDYLAERARLEASLPGTDAASASTSMMG